MYEPRGEQLINCPFCENDPREPDHYVVGKLLMERPDGIVVQLAMTCVHALPAERHDRWEPWTFFLVESLMQMGGTQEGGERERAIPIAKEDEAWAEKLLKRLEEGADDEAA